MVVGSAHERVTGTCQGCKLLGVSPVLAGQGCLGVDTVGHIQTWLVELVAAAILAAALEEADSLVEVLIDLCVSLCQCGEGEVASRLVQTEHNARAVTLLILPTVAVELCQTEERIGTEGKSLCLQEGLVGLGA